MINTVCEMYVFTPIMNTSVPLITEILTLVMYPFRLSEHLALLLSFVLTYQQYPVTFNFLAPAVCAIFCE
jgi:hypothetical protein